MFRFLILTLTAINLAACSTSVSDSSGGGKAPANPAQLNGPGNKPGMTGQPSTESNSAYAPDPFLTKQAEEQAEQAKRAEQAAKQQANVQPKVTVQPTVSAEPKITVEPKVTVVESQPKSEPEIRVQPKVTVVEIKPEETTPPPAPIVEKKRPEPVRPASVHGGEPGRVGSLVNFSEKYKLDSTTWRPIIKSADYTIFAEGTLDSWPRANFSIQVIRVNKGDDLTARAASMKVDWMTDSSPSYAQHFVPRGVELKDGSLLVVVVDGSNLNGAHRTTHVMKVDSNLNVIGTFGKNGVITFGETGTVFNYRFIKNIEESEKGDLTLSERRTVQEGNSGFGTTPDQCYQIKVSSKGKLDPKFGKKGYKSISCDSIPE